MAKIVVHHEAKENRLAYDEIIEVRVWGLCGTENQPFYIGSGANARSSWTIFIEILYTVAGAQLFYTRNFIDHIWHPQQADPPEAEPEPVEEHPSVTMIREMMGPEAWEKMQGPYLTPAEQLEKLLKTNEGTFGFSAHLPETSIFLKGERATHRFTLDEEENGAGFEDKIDGENDNETGNEPHGWFDVIISADTSSVFSGSGPGDRMIEIRIPMIKPEIGGQFMRELMAELGECTKGTHPNPADYPIGSSRWLLVEQLARQTYDQAAEQFYENYFNNPKVAELFTGWLAGIRPFGQVLDVGCGRGEPVIRHLLRQGLQVTGSDLSPEMLRLANELFPQASFIEQASTQPLPPETFDAACSFNSLLYLDPVDLLNSVHRLHGALKAGATLFLYGYDSGPSWKGEPFHDFMGHLIWAWHYGMEEAAGLLQEHGYFKVLQMCRVTEDPDEAARIAAEEEKRRLKEEEFQKRMTEELGGMPILFSPPPVERSPYAYVIIAQRI